MFNFSIVLLAAQVNGKIESDIEFSMRRDQFTLHVYSPNKGYICVKMMARHQVFVFVGLFFFLSFESVLKIDKKCANSHKDHNYSIAQLLRLLTIVSAKSKIHSSR